MFSKINGFATAKSLGVAFSLAVVLSVAFIAPTNAFAFDGYELDSSYSYGYDNWSYDYGCGDCGSWAYDLDYGYTYDYGCYDCGGYYDDYYYTDYYSYDCCYSVGYDSYSYYYPNTTYTYPSYNYSYPTYSYAAPTYYTAPPVPDRMTGSQNSNPTTVVNNIDNSINDSFNTYTNSFNTNSYNSGSFNAITVSSGTKSSDVSAAAVEITPTTVTVASVAAPVTTGYVQPVSYSQSWYGASSYYTPSYTPAYTAPVTASYPYVALSQIPYTGFDFGPMGNAMYWVGLALFAIAGAYLVVFYRGGMFAFASQIMGGRRNPIRVTLPVAPMQTKMVAREVPVQRSETNGATKDSLSMVRVGGMPQLVVSRF